MSQPQTLTVDQQEILSRANEVEAPMATPPTDVPAPPCALSAAQNAAQQLGLSADNMRTYLVAGAKERSKLATSLRNAAKAYGEVDDEAATSLNNDGAGTIETQTAGGGGGNSSGDLQDTPKAAGAGDPNFEDLKAAARKLEAGDQGNSIAVFADNWNKINFALQGDVKRFRVFENWTGDAASACEASLDQQREWILHMAKLANALYKQAIYIAQLQVWARKSHPTVADIESLEQDAKDPNKQAAAIKVYSEYQATSEKVMTEYSNKANLDPINPPKPPAAIKVDPPPPAQTPGLIPGFLMPADGSGGGTGGQTPPMAPMAPSAGAGGGMPPGTASELTAAGRDAAASLSKDPGIKPMSLGGGGGGGGMPAVPLAPATGIDGGESMRPAGAGDPSGLAGGKTASGAAAGGGGGGMPMGGAGQNQGGSKSKSATGDDEALYTEDREWTEAVIGQRRRQDSKESK